MAAKREAFLSVLLAVCVYALNHTISSNHSVTQVNAQVEIPMPPSYPGVYRDLDVVGNKYLYALNYLRKYGYLAEENILENRTVLGSAFKDAVELYQRMRTLRVTGEIDEASMEQMEAPRCGNADIIRANSSTKMNSAVSTNEPSHKLSSAECSTGVLWWLPVLKECKKYQECARGNLSVKSCPQDLVWKEEKLWCDYPDSEPNVVCTPSK